MFEAGSLLLFKPFLFKNGAMPKDKFFLVLEQMEGEVLLASLPTSKDHVPSDVEVKHGCLEMADRFVNVFVFMAGERIVFRENGEYFSFSKNTFVYGANLDLCHVSQFELQEQLEQTVIEKIGILDAEIFAELKECLANSKMVKNKYRKILKGA